MDGALVSGDQRTGFVDRLADDVHDAAERFRADRNHDRSAGVRDFLAADETFGRVHGDRADGVFAEMLRNFENQAVALVLGFQRVQDRRQFAAGERYVHDSADNLGHLADGACCCCSGFHGGFLRSCASHDLSSFLTLRALRRPK